MTSYKTLCATLFAVAGFGTTMALALPAAPQAGSQQPTLTAAQKAVLTNALACIRGAVETAYAIAPDKLTGDSVKDTRVIAEASNKVCITADLIDGFGGAQAKTPQDKEKAVLETMKWYGFTTERVIKQRATATSQPKGK